MTYVKDILLPEILLIVILDPVYTKYVADLLDEIFDTTALVLSRTKSTRLSYCATNGVSLRATIINPARRGAIVRTPPDGIDAAVPRKE